MFYRKSSLSDAEWEAFNLELDKALEHIQGSFISHDPNVLAREITQTYVSLIDKYMPLKKISNKRKRNPDKPWITKGIKKSVRTKFKLYKKAKKTKNQRNWSSYSKYLNVLTKTKYKAKCIYYKNLSVLYG